MDFNSEKIFEVSKKNKVDNNNESKKELSEEDILCFNNVELLVKYAKESRSKAAIERVRELLESARKTGEEVVQNFQNSFKECEKEKIDYLNFESTKSGQQAFNLLQKMPEPFKTVAINKLEDCKKELEINTELFKKHKNNSEEIWKKTFGFDYYNIPDFKERFKTFLFTDIRAIFDNYYKNNTLEVNQDPFAINFFVGDTENFNKAFNSVYRKNTEKTHEKFDAFSDKKDQHHVNVFKKEKLDDDMMSHESEHAVHRMANPIKAEILESGRIQDNFGFNFNKGQVNNGARFDVTEKLKQAKDEVFAYLKGGTAKEDLEYILNYKGDDSPYDYNRKGRDLDNVTIDDNEYLSEMEKKKLKEAINFLQLEYDRVLKNMIDVIYDQNHSVEFFRNVPINELWKYSNGKYKRTDFIIKEFKF